MTKHEWRKKEKEYYLPKTKPEIIDVPKFKFVAISGEGNPNSPFFSDCVSALYAFSYVTKMSLKKTAPPPEGYYDYTVYPLEGIWDLNKEAKARGESSFDKDDLIFTIMIRQPDFIDYDVFTEMLGAAKKKKPSHLLDQLEFIEIHEGACIQMMHIGSFDDEPISFNIMEKFAEQSGLERISKAHREIYLSDFRKVAPEKMKTILRFGVVTKT